MLMLDYTGGIGVSDSVLIQIDNLGVPRVGILNTFAGEIIWLSREDLAGYDGDVWVKFEVNDGWGSNFSDSLRSRVDNNNLPSVSTLNQ